jgi:hypothetical protein
VLEDHRRGVAHFEGELGGIGDDREAVGAEGMA